MIYPEPQFYNIDGSLTAYSLACGYVQDIGNGWKLYRDGCYHLHKDIDNWLTFSKLTDARKAARLIIKES
jgi:hypothetical protein